MGDPFHFPPELLEQMVETLPRLIRGKVGLLDFFASAGVSAAQLEDLRRQVRQDRGRIGKFEITRIVLVELNRAGDEAIRQRREVLKRVVEWEDFSTCWPNDRLKVQGLVAELRRVVNVKDAFTRMSLERQREAQKGKERYEQEAAVLRQREASMLDLRDRLAACFGSKNPQRRGKDLEGVLNDYFRLQAVSIREAFHVVGSSGEGIVEQIDGAIGIAGQPFLVEMKWWSQPIGVEQIGHFLAKVFTRSCGGVFIAHPQVTGPALNFCREAIVKGSTVFVVRLEELYRLLDERANLATYLRDRVNQAVLEKRP